MKEPTPHTRAVATFVVDATNTTPQPPYSAPSTNETPGSPVVGIGLVANMFVRQMDFRKAGDTEQGHTHAFDHLTLLASGQLAVDIEGVVTEYAAPTMIYIKKEVRHKLTSIADGTVAYCIHGLRDLDVSDDILSPDSVPKGAECERLLHQIRT